MRIQTSTQSLKKFKIYYYTHKNTRAKSTFHRNTSRVSNRKKHIYYAWPIFLQVCSLWIMHWSNTHFLLCFLVILLQQLAYRYAKRGAYLVLVARREAALKAVAKTALDCGAPDVLVIPADISDCSESKRVVDEAIAHFGQRTKLNSRWAFSSMDRTEIFLTSCFCAIVLQWITS